MKNNYKTRLETFCMECEMGEARLVDQQKFAKDLRELFDENARLNEIIHAKNARYSIEEQISNEILDGTYNPSSTDFDYETDFHSKLQKFVKENKKY